MDRETADALAAINRTFYRERAAEFDASRQHPWAGWQRALACLEREPLARPLRVLDVGCGNGRFAGFLQRSLAPRGHDFRYVGIDTSLALLRRARGHLRALPQGRAALVCADWQATSPDRALPVGRFALVAVFGVLHHVPGHARRRDLLVAAAERLARGGWLVLSAWQFAARDRLRRRLVPWDDYNRCAGRPIDPDRLEPGDHLLRWGAPDRGAVRYCHFVDAAELERLTDGLGLERVASYEADGREGDLNRYLVLRDPARAARGACPQGA